MKIEKNTKKIEFFPWPQRNISILLKIMRQFSKICLTVLQKLESEIKLKLDGKNIQTVPYNKI